MNLIDAHSKIILLKPPPASTRRFSDVTPTGRTKAGIGALGKCLAAIRDHNEYLDPSQGQEVGSRAPPQHLLPGFLSVRIRSPNKIILFLSYFLALG